MEDSQAASMTQCNSMCLPKVNLQKLLTTICEFPMGRASKEVSGTLSTELPIRRDLSGPLHQVDVRFNGELRVRGPIGNLRVLVEDAVENGSRFRCPDDQSRGCVQRVDWVQKPGPVI